MAYFQSLKWTLKWARMKRIAIAVTILLFAFSAKATDHTIRLEIHNGGDTVGWHFSRYDGPKTWEIVIKEVPIGFHRGSRFTKIRHMDDDSSPRRMARDQRFDETFQIQGPAIYILDFSDWSNDCNVEAKITIDGKERFSTSSYGINRKGGASFNINNWHNNWHDARQTDDREIAIDVD